ncbi:type II toxin-antitoxin system RatA family toxin [Parvularcula sp. ZS-1/3]|uniref:Type II toxin-antitoxin system RatA family toxin n=1 Tax=Parvularcula mediterranea TaxID=2732508 RepID=A0A7Y3RMF8_9PROT|nr:type II toxin-antitoxin system RatA family toxin [Parvularcula mediterranea]NNU16798.1 type II toxin-antitoxin system RatA family toxin [Parvularcula mediterranea]
MTAHHERILVPYTPDQMFELVMDVRKYPRFIPFVEALRVTSDDRAEDGTGQLCADMVVRYSVFRETFRSEVTAAREGHTVDIRYVKGPLQNLTNNWKFEPHEKGCCIDFRLDFAFNNRLMQAAAMKFVDHGFKRMSGAFIKEAGKRYEPVGA